jgi:hypothetical protein
MNFSFNRAVALFVISSTVMIAVTSCSKSNSSSSAGISATVNGTAWNNTYPVAGIYYTGGSEFDVAGAQFKGGDTTAFELIFYSPVTLNRAVSSDTSQITVGYIDARTGNVYSGAYGSGHAIVTVTSYDSTGGKVGGTFSGVLWNTVNSNDSLVIAGGKFNTTFQKQ